MDLEPAPETAGQLLRRYRVRAGISQDELAGRAGLSLRAIRDIERGRVRHPREESLARLTAALRLSDPEQDELLAMVAATAGTDQRPRIGILGPLLVWRGGGPVDLGPPMRRRLLGLLALHPRQVLRREEIVDALWPDRPPRTYASLIQVYIGQLRALLDPERPKGSAGSAIALAHGGYRLDIGDDQLDLSRFDALVARARQSRGTGDAAAALESLARALRCWRGPVLVDAGPTLRQHPAAVAATHRRVAATMAYAELALGLAEPHRAIDHLRALSHDEPTHEGVQARLMLALAGSGEPAAALRLYADLRERLRAELGTEPGTELQAAHLRVLRGEVPAGATLSTVDETSAPARPAQLPAGTAAFTGRRAQLRYLDARLASRGAAVTVISGTAGVGKTSLAVYWAHRVRDRFPDGQLFVDLHGYATTAPTPPIQALSGFLRALGTPADRIPTTVDEASGLYRSLLADRRLLVVLDNAHHVDQVRPLLPGGEGCLALVTSRHRLSGLVAVEGAQRIALDTLTGPEGRRLLHKLLDRHRVTAEPDAVAALVDACGRLPLALRVAAANLADEPGRAIADYVARLAAGRIVAFRVDDDEQAAVGAAFELSYRRLPVDARRLFRLLGVDPGHDITTEAAAALAGVSTEDAQRLLDTLVDAHLVVAAGLGRYSCHDLIRRYARDRAQADDREADRRAALDRLFDHYLQTVEAAAGVLYPHILRLPRPPAPDAFAAPAPALAWLDAERANLVAAVVHAADHGPHPMAWLLADALRGYFANRLHAIDWLTTARAGLAAAEAEDEPQAMASAQMSLGTLRWRQSQHRDAIDHYAHALTHARRAGWLEGQAAILGNLGANWTEQGDVTEGVRHFAGALALHRQTGRLVGQAAALTNMGTAFLELGQLEEAIDHITQALEIYRQLGSRAGEAISLTNLGETFQQSGRLDEALAHLTEALALHREAGNRGNEADTLAGLAAVYRDLGRLPQALELAGEAVAVAKDCGHPAFEAFALNILATVHHGLHEYRPALDLHRRARHLAGAVGNRYAEVAALVGEATAHQHLGQRAEAVARATEALAAARAAGFRILASRAEAVLANPN